MREIQRGGCMECNEIRNLYFERSSGEHARKLYRKRCIKCNERIYAQP